MKSNHFGPWATSISQGGNAQATTFWRKRLKMLDCEPYAHARSKRWALWLGTFAITVLSVPIWHHPSAPEELQQLPSACADTTGDPTNE